jgi:glyoxylase-like metal-dependent hydrolase (beta-lactamase superfamily II)
MTGTSVRLAPHLQVLERGWLSSNSIVFDDGDGVSVVDTGYHLHAQQLAALLDRVRGAKPLARIVNTHLHSDHVGGNALLIERHRPAVIIPPGLAAAVRAWDEEALSYAPTGQHCPRFAYDALLAPGGSIELGHRAWEVHAAPGHDPHMVMLFDPRDRILISADALWENGFGAIFPELEGESGFAEQRAVLDLIDALAPAIVIPGHGKPFTDVAGALARARARLAALASDPARNARHVLKVLVKFRLLQVREADAEELVRHFAAARFVRSIQARHGVAASPAAALERAIDELVESRALRRDGTRLFDNG